MSQIGYREIPPPDQKKAKDFFDRGATVAGTGNFEYAIEMYLQGLTLDPEAIEAHQALREIGLKRKASGGKAIGMIQAMGLKRSAKDDKVSMLNYEKLLSFDPGNTDHMQGFFQYAYKAGCYETVLWIGSILIKANADTPKPEYSKYIILKDTYRELGRLTNRFDILKRSTEAAQFAIALRPDDMDLQRELKDLGAETTMREGNYGTGGSFRDSARDMTGQQKLLVEEKDARTEDQMTGLIRGAEAEFNAQPTETGKLMHLVELLLKTEQTQHENRAIELLDQAYERTKQFRFRQNIGQIRMRQLIRMERALRDKVQKNPQDASAVEEFKQFHKDRIEEELREYQLCLDNYPSQLEFKHQVARRLFELERYDEAIPLFQQSRQDPKVRIEASVDLGRAFLAAGFVDEAVDTLKAVMEDYQLKGDEKSIDMTYWYARSLEEKQDFPTAIKAYSQVAQWNFNFRDVQKRIKALRAAPKA